MSKEAGMLTEMGRLLNDENNDITAAPAFGSLVGMSGGVAFMIAVEGVGSGASPYEISAMQSEVHGLQLAKSEIPGSTQAAIVSRHSIDGAIARKRTEIQQAKPPHVPLAEGVAEVGGPLVGGAALGMFVFTAIAARIRIARRNRTTPTPANS